MARNSVLTAAQENTGIGREAVVTVPGVEQAGWRLPTVILAFSFSWNREYFINNIVLTNLTNNLSATGAAIRSTDTLLAGGLVVCAAE